MDNIFIEASHARLQDEGLYENWYMSLADAREKIEKWCCYYHDDRFPWRLMASRSENVCPDDSIAEPTNYKTNIRNGTTIGA